MLAACQPATPFRVAVRWHDLCFGLGAVCCAIRRFVIMATSACVADRTASPLGVRPRRAFRRSACYLLGFSPPAPMHNLPLWQPSPGSSLRMGVSDGMSMKSCRLMTAHLSGNGCRSVPGILGSTRSHRRSRKRSYLDRDTGISRPICLMIACDRSVFRPAPHRASDKSRAYLYRSQASSRPTINISILPDAVAALFIVLPR